MYTEVVMDHFKNPCGDMMTIYIKVKDDSIDDISFLTFGCGAAIAVSSILTEMAKGRTIEEAQLITNKSVAEALDGLPKNKLHCSNLGADALHMAIKDYLDRKAGIVKKEPKRSAEHVHDHGDGCYCPYCDVEAEGDSPVCVNCGQELDEAH
jgi:nitrogen fixation NifU-like protein